jgi:ATP-dependent Lon protease
VKAKIDIKPVARADDVLKLALVRMPERIVWDEAAAALAAKEETANETRPVAH